MTKIEGNEGSSRVKPGPVFVRTEGAFHAGVTLNLKNYKIWSQMLEMQIAGREKLSFIRENIDPPNKETEEYEHWYADNQKVKGWLIQSMTEDLMSRFISLPTARDVWLAVRNSFYDDEDEVQVFSLNQRAFRAKQGGRSISDYFGELMEIFRELDQRDKVVMKNVEDVKMYRDSIEHLRVHIFLAGLNEAFEQVRGEVLRRTTIPSLEESFAYIRREEARKTIMKSTMINEEAAAMFVKHKIKPQKTEGRIFQCTQCGKPGHTRDRCYELVGFPDWWDPSRARKPVRKEAMVSTTVATKLEEPDSSKACVTTSTMPGISTNSHCLNGKWMIDSGCTDHTTHDDTLINNVKRSIRGSIMSANGGRSTILGEGSVTLTDDMNLDTVLLVPNLKYNLLSVSQLTKALNCVVIFWPDWCVFKDILTKKTIGYGIRHGRLYYLELEANTDQLGAALVNQKSLEVQKGEDIVLWHKRLGHASFDYIKKLFSPSFNNTDTSKLYCETCALAKSHRTSFPLHTNKSSKPFMLIHSDVWGPCKVPTFDGKVWFVTFIDDCTRVTWTWLMVAKSEVGNLVKRFCTMAATQYQCKVQAVRTDNGGGYMSHDLQEFFRLEGILHQTTCPYTPQ